MAMPDDVTVNRQVLAEPEAGLSDRTWAALADGTPLVTAAKRGKGEIVLFHVTADARWSNLPLSGAFVEMLKRIVGIAGLVSADAQPQEEASREFLPPTRILNGFGAFGPPPSTARPTPANYTGRAKADIPPGFYGPPEGFIAVNTLTPADRLKPIDFSALHARVEPYRVGEPMDLRGPLFAIALLLLLADGIVVFLLGGGIQRLRPRRAGAAALILLGTFAAASIGGNHAYAQHALTQNKLAQNYLFQDRPPTRSQGILAPSQDKPPASNPTDQFSAADQFAMKATSETHLAYVITGDTEVDNISKAGLAGLSLFLAQHTALEPGDPMGLDISRDELSFFPLIYWPIVPGAPKPSAAALSRIDAYMKQGGTVLFDTRDAVMAPPGAENRSPGMVTLRSILSSLDVPELEPIPRDHVLTKTFYLLRDFPGRFTSGQLWVEALQPEKDDDDSKRPARGGDGVSSILITSNDLAGAWAQQPDGRAMLPLTPGEPRQREFAYRAGVNIVMYTLTGNYKADQVHVPALIERLGQ
jgi:hypothetical protein